MATYETSRGSLLLRLKALVSGDNNRPSFRFPRPTDLSRFADCATQDAIGKDASATRCGASHQTTPVSYGTDTPLVAEGTG